MHKVGLLHRHVVALLNETFLRVGIATRPNLLLRSCCLINAVIGFLFETLLAGVEHDLMVLGRAVPMYDRLAHCPRLLIPHAAIAVVPRSVFKMCVFLVDARPWYVEVEALAVERLMRMEARGRVIECERLAHASGCLIVAGALTLLLPHIGFLQARNLIFHAIKCILVIHYLTLLALRDNFVPWAALIAQDTNVRVI